jgi:hypothetical protein
MATAKSTEENTLILQQGPSSGSSSPPLGLLLDDEDEAVKLQLSNGGNAGGNNTNAVSAAAAAASDDVAAEAALDSILETSVAEVNLALSHVDASTAAAAAAIADAARHAADLAMGHSHNDVTTTMVVTNEVDATNSTTAAHKDRTSESSQEHQQSHQPPEQSLQQQPNTLAGNKRSLNELEGAAPDTWNHPSTTTNTNSTPLEVAAAAAAAAVGNDATSPAAVDASGFRVGRWTLDEKILFLFGLQKFGKGRWKKISTYVPQRYVIVVVLQCIPYGIFCVVAQVSHFPSLDLWCKSRVMRKRCSNAWRVGKTSLDDWKKTCRGCTRWWDKSTKPTDWPHPLSFCNHPHNHKCHSHHHGSRSNHCQRPKQTLLLPRRHPQRLLRNQHLRPNQRLWLPSRLPLRRTMAPPMEALLPLRWVQRPCIIRTSSDVSSRKKPMGRRNISWPHRPCVNWRVPIVKGMLVAAIIPYRKVERVVMAVPRPLQGRTRTIQV